MKRKRLQSDSSPHHNSSGALRFKISLTKGEIEADPHEDKAMEPATSSNLLKVLLEVHRQFVKRDTKGIFANPVTLDIAPDYFSVISSPMDLGTMHSKLLSRRCYATAGQYLSDLRLMCTNAMRYNPPETVYYQKARKLLAFGEKLLSSMTLQRICTDLGLPEGLTVAEMGDLEHRPQTHRHWTSTASASSVASPHHFTPPPQFCETTRLSSRKARPPDRRPSDCAPSPPSLIPARLSPEFSRSPPALELRQSPPSLKRSSFSASSTGGGYDASDVNSSKPSTPRSVSGAEPQQPLSPQLSSQSQQQQQQQPAESSVLRASSSRGALFEQDSELIESSLSPAPSTPQSASPISDYASACASQRQSGRSSARSSRLPAPASAPVLLTSGRRQSRPPERLECSRPVSGSDTPRMIGRKSTTRKPPDITPKKVLRNSANCKASGRRKSHLRSISKSGRCHSPTPTSPQQSSTVSSPAPKSSPFRMYAEDAWSFSDSMTDLTPPDQILAQVREAARKAREGVIARYGPAASVKPEDAESAGTCQTSLQKIVYLDVSQPGRISAVPCPLAETRNPDQSQASLEAPVCETKPLPVCYPPALVQLLTGRGPGLYDQPAVPEASEENSATRTSLAKSTYHGLIEQMTSQEVNTLHALSKLRYKEDEPIAANIHGPLGIFDTSELAEMFDVYGGDPVTVEYVLSLLTFVESVGPWARREITKKLDVATSGLHSQMLASFLAAKKTSAESTNWMSTAGLTIDPPKPVTPPAPKITCSNDSETSTTRPVPASCPPDSKAASTAVIQPLSSTHTVLHTRQTATVLPLQRSGQAGTSQEDNHHSVTVPGTASTQSDAGPGVSSVQLVESKSPATCSSNAVTPDPVQGSSAPQSTTSLLMPSTVCTVSVSVPSTVLVVDCPSQAGHESDAECTGRPPTLPSVTSADSQHESSNRTGPVSVSCSDNVKDPVAETPQTERCSSSAPADSFRTNPADDHPSQPESLLVCPPSPCTRVDHTERLQTHTVHPATDCQEVAVSSDQPLVLERCLQPVGTEEGPTEGNEETAQKGKSLAVQGQDALLKNSTVNQSAVVLPRPASAQNFTIEGEPEEEDQGNGLRGNRERSESAPPSLIGEFDQHCFVPVLTDPN
ncbi:Bromodomain containing protein 7 [Sparganum proliferum]